MKKSLIFLAIILVSGGLGWKAGAQTFPAEKIIQTTQQFILNLAEKLAAGLGGGENRQPDEKIENVEPMKKTGEQTPEIDGQIRDIGRQIPDITTQAGLDPIQGIRDALGQRDRAIEANPDDTGWLEPEPEGGTGPVTPAPSPVPGQPSQIPQLVGPPPDLRPQPDPEIIPVAYAPLYDWTSGKWDPDWGPEPKIIEFVDDQGYIEDEMQAIAKTLLAAEELTEALVEKGNQLDQPNPEINLQLTLLATPESDPSQDI